MIATLDDHNYGQKTLCFSALGPAQPTTPSLSETEGAFFMASAYRTWREKDQVGKVNQEVKKQFVEDKLFYFLKRKSVMYFLLFLFQSFLVWI